MSRPYDIVIFGLSLSSSWGNGHATTYRALLRGLHAEGRRVLFVECDKPWYAAHRDLPDPDFCTLEFYSDLGDIERYRQAVRAADAVIVGSYVPDGSQLIDMLAEIDPAALCFYDIDTPVTMARLDRGEEDYLARRQVPLFDIYFSFSGGEVLQRLEEEYGARRAEALFCSVDEERYFETGEAKRWDLGYLGTYSPDRQPTLERLLLEPARRLPDRRFAVAGPGYSDRDTWPANVEAIDHLPPCDHRSFYNSQRFTLNVTRADMIAAGWSPSVRLFEAAACGTPIVSDRWRGLDELLPEGEAIVIADGSDDVVALLSAPEEGARGDMAAAAKARVLAAHTGRARARELLRAVRGQAAERPRAAAAG